MQHLGAYALECWNASGNAAASGTRQEMSCYRKRSDGGIQACNVCRQSFNAVLSEADLHETYLHGWRAAATQANLTGAMCSYVTLPLLMLRWWH